MATPLRLIITAVCLPLWHSVSPGWKVGYAILFGLSLATAIWPWTSGRSS